MTLRLPMLFAAFLLFATSVARASPIPSSTDEARALAATRLPLQHTHLVASQVASSTDEARALAATRQPWPPSQYMATHTIPSTSDEARAFAAGRRQGMDVNDRSVPPVQSPATAAAVRHGAVAGTRNGN